MPSFHRYYIPDALVFITCVTFHRLPHFQNPDCIDLFWETQRNVQKLHPFHLLAYVILPDHFHWIMQMPEEQTNFSVVMQSIKWNYTRNFCKKFNTGPSTRIWQARFWDHIVRDERDLSNHLDYIHWNPVKHSYVNQPELWQQSSYLHCVEQGMYQPHWGNDHEPENIRGLNME